MSENIISLLGMELAKYVNVNPIASKGIIRLAIKDDFGSVEDLTIDKLQKVIKSSLKNRLNTLNILDIDRIIEHLEKELIQNQSLLTMASF